MPGRKAGKFTPRNPARRAHANSSIDACTSQAGNIGEADVALGLDAHCVGEPPVVDTDADRRQILLDRVERKRVVVPPIASSGR